MSYILLKVFWHFISIKISLTTDDINMYKTWKLLIGKILSHKSSFHLSFLLSIFIFTSSFPILQIFHPSKIKKTNISQSNYDSIAIRRIAIINSYTSSTEHRYIHPFYRNPIHLTFEQSLTLQINTSLYIRRVSLF